MNEDKAVKRPALNPGNAVLYDRMFESYNAVKQQYLAVREQWVAFCEPLGLDPEERYSMSEDGVMITHAERVAEVREAALARGEDPDHRNPLIAKDGTVVEKGTGETKARVTDA